jgi:hypothetical protein
MTTWKSPRHTRAPEPDRPGRSSFEAYIGYGVAVCTVVFEVTIWFKFVLFVLLLMFGIYLIWTSQRTHKLGRGWRIFGVAVLIVFLFGLGAPNLAKQYQKERRIPYGFYITGYCGYVGPFVLSPGAQPHVVSGDPMVSAGVNGDALINYKDRFKLVLVMFRWYAHVEAFDEPNISKSVPFNIQHGEIVISVPLNPSALSERRVRGRDEYFLLAVPPNLDSKRFDTVNQFISAGAYPIDDRACVPEPLTPEPPSGATSPPQ